MEKKCKTPFWDNSLAIEQRIEYLLREMKIEEKFAFLSTKHPALERMGISAFSFGGEAAHGVEARNDQSEGENIADKTTSFSQPIGMSASWDEELMEQVGEIVGMEARALFNRKKRGGLSRWAPTVDMERDPRWGRTEEGYGEDPLLTGKMAAAYIRGMQGMDKGYLRMAASVKHFYANNVEDGRIWKSSSIDPRNKYEYYLESFRRAVMEGHAEVMMTAYNEINGVPAILNHEVYDLVKGEWGLSGHVVCDGGDMIQTVESHHYYESHAETVAEALKAGIDCFTDDPDVVERAVREAYERQLITETEINQALRNSFRTKFRLGLYDGQADPYKDIGENVLNTGFAAALSRKMAQESGVLLKNEGGFLPLSKDETIVLIGPVGDAWFQDWYGGEPPYRVSLKRGIENLLGRAVSFECGLPQVRLKQGKQYVGLGEGQKLVLTEEKRQAVILEVTDWGFESMTLYVPMLKKYISLHDDGFLRADKKEAFGWFVKEKFSIKKKADGICLYGWNGCSIVIDEGLRAKEKEEAAVFETEPVKDGVKEAVKLAASSAKVIVALGCNPMINSKEEIDRTDIILPPKQEELIREIYKVNPNVVMMLLTNYPYSINWEQEHIPAILQMATGSQEMGNAAADLLFGEANPSGRLPLTWYRSVKDLPDINDYDIIKGKRTYQYYSGEVLYPFGYGKSYTTFLYGELEIIQDQENLIVSVNVKNTGARSGDEVVQVYGTRFSFSRIQYPIKRLIGFRRIRDILPGEERKVEFKIPCKELEVYDVIGRRKILETGTYLFTLGQRGEYVKLDISGEKIQMRRPMEYTPADHYDDYDNIVLRNAGNGKTCTAVLRSEERSMLIYRDFLWTGMEKHIILKLRSGKEGEIRVLLTGRKKKKYEIARWRGVLQSGFLNVDLLLKPWEKEMDALCLELEGGVEIEGFEFKQS